MSSSGMCTAHKLAWVLVIIGALNWGLIGFLNFNLVEAILGGLPTLERLVYAVVGLSAVFSLFSKNCSQCQTGHRRPPQV